MGFWDRVNARVFKEYRQSSLADGPQWLIDAWGGTATMAGERVNTENAMAIADVFAAVSIIAEDISQLPLNVYRDLGRVPDNPQNGVVEATDHRAYRMLHDMPNPYTPAHRFWSTVATHQLLWGNWYLEKLRGPTGLVEELRLCHPSEVEVQFNPDTGRKRFLVQRPGGSREMLSDDRVLHGFGLSQDGLVGMSPITQARESLGTAKARIRFEGEVYAQKPFLSGVIQHPSSLKDTVKLRESWRSIYGGGHRNATAPPSGRFNVAVLEEGATYHQLTAPLQDMEFVASARLSKTEIAVLFKLPPAYLGGSTGDSLTYQTVEMNKIQKATQAIAPVANNIAQFLSHDFSIFPFQSWYCEFTMEGMLRGDSGARADYWERMQPVLNLKPAYIAEKENIPMSALDPKKEEPVITLPRPEPSAPSPTMAGVNGNG